MWQKEKEKDKEMTFLFVFFVDDVDLKYTKTF